VVGEVVLQLLQRTDLLSKNRWQAAEEAEHDKKEKRQATEEMSLFMNDVLTKLPSLCEQKRIESVQHAALNISLCDNS
jgi:hypothetical protein